MIKTKLLYHPIITKSNVIHALVQLLIFLIIFDALKYGY